MKNKYSIFYTIAIALALGQIWYGIATHNTQAEIIGTVYFVGSLIMRKLERA